jgi:hypothetical protein
MSDTTTKQANGRGPNSATPFSTTGAEESATEHTANHGPAAPEAGPTPRPETEATEPWQPLLRDLEQLRELFSHYSAARADLVRARVRGVVARVAALLVAVIVLATVLISAVVLTLTGLAHALATAAGDRLWVGQLGVGGGILLLMVVVCLAGARLSSRRNLQHLREKYEHRRECQRQRYGSAVGDNQPLPK